ncbi:MAG: OB-fold domain-containing protein [Thermodesulfobacteriota bacterium]
MSTTAKPVPRVTPELAPFFAAAKRGELAVQRCTECGLLRFPPREVCSRCWSRGADWTFVSGRGQVYSFYVMHQVYHPGFAGEVPYPVVVVELEEGPRVLSNLVGCARDEIAIGMPVEATFEQLDGTVTLPKFRPRRG